MKIRPVDENGDILPVLSPVDLLRGAPAVAQLAEYRLNLLTGDWWENPSSGNSAVDMLAGSRLTAADQQVLANYLSEYIRKTPGVLELREVRSSVGNRRFFYSCIAETADGPAEMEFMI